MKKCMLGVAAAMAFSAVCVAEGLESANIVGYVTSPKIAANKVSLGTTPFSATGSDMVKIQDMVVPSVAAVPYKDRSTKALQLQVWNGTGYDVYFYLSDAYIEETDEEVTGWANGKGDYTFAEIAPGTGYWYKYPTAESTYTLPGQVLSAASVTKNVYASKLNLVGNPYPMALNLNNLKTSVPAATYRDRVSKAVQLQVWNGTGYDVCFYLSDAYIEDTDEEVTGWANGKGDFVSALNVDVTAGLWVKSPNGDGTITFFKDAQ